MVALGGVATLRTQYVAAVTVPARAHLFGALLAHALEEEEEETTGSPGRQLDRRRVASWAMDAGMAEAAWVPFRLLTTGFAAPMVRVPHTRSLSDRMGTVAKPLVSNTARRQPPPNHVAFRRRSWLEQCDASHPSPSWHPLEHEVFTSGVGWPTSQRRLGAPVGGLMVVPLSEERSPEVSMVVCGGRWHGC
jgi:hypothetical protein